MNSSVETVNAAAAAIVTAENRVQPPPIQKRRWGSCWSLYWCFGSQKNSHRIGHATFVPEPTGHGSTVPPAENVNHSTPIVMPFIAPPSSPASFLQSDPPTATQSPGGLLTLSSLSINANSGSGPANIFAIGPYAHETQLVSPPVFSAFTTEPSTAAVTPPPEPLQLTTPPSPEVPFAQLLTSSLNRTRRNSGFNQKRGLSYYEIHQLYSGSPASHLISPGSVNSASGTSSPYPVNLPVLEFRMADASKLFDSKSFTTHKWGSRLGSGTLTPDALGPDSRDSLPRENQISEVVSLANSEPGSPGEESFVDHRVSFELTGEDIPTCVERRVFPSLQTISDSKQEAETEADQGGNGMPCEFYAGEASLPTLLTVGENRQKNCSISLGSVKEFNFDSSEVQLPDNTQDSSWWADGEVGKELESQNNWTFFPLLQPGVS